MYVVCKMYTIDALPAVKIVIFSVDIAIFTSLDPLTKLVINFLKTVAYNITVP